MLAWIMRMLAFLRLALNDTNENTVQLKSLQSTVCILPSVCVSPPIRGLQSAFYNGRSTM